jgi:uncharacterized glyoxalase superfamily protein PhnB
MTTNQSRPPGQVIPTLYYDDVGKALAWLCDAFGFEERFRYGPPDDLGGAQLRAGGGTVMIGKSRVGQSPGWGDTATLGPPLDARLSVSISVHIDDVDQHCERARRARARIIHAPETYPFGERQYMAEDFAGNRWGFSQTVADVAPGAWGAVEEPAK